MIFPNRKISGGSSEPDRGQDAGDASSERGCAGHDVPLPPLLLGPLDQGTGNGTRRRIPTRISRGQKCSRMYHSAR